ncbi:hypothetical protein F4808DRAFT_175601 [Astrocystis sublimbata]|nr:hypothetical protein F4808DRAFT_175601 [Astrocystis sublimbata]
MQFSTIFVSTLAAVASAAPAATTPEKRVNLDLNAFNKFAFANTDLQYFNAINAFDLQAFAQLAAFNDLQIGGFQNLFNNNVIDVNALLQLQQLALLSQLGSLGVFGNFDLSTLNLDILNLGLVNGIGNFNLGSLIDSGLKPQIQAIIQKTEFAAVVI